MDRWDLERFVSAQGDDEAFGRMVDELRRERKTGHWMWYVFPQVAGLGYSAMSQRYAISSIEEAQAYLAHPVLGPRLLECAGIVASARASSAEQILGSVDAQKLHSSMTLFMRAAARQSDSEHVTVEESDVEEASGAGRPGSAVFAAVLDTYFSGTPDAATDSRLRSRPLESAPPAPGSIAAD